MFFWKTAFLKNLINTVITDGVMATLEELLGLTNDSTLLHSDALWSFGHSECNRVKLSACFCCFTKRLSKN